MADRIRPLKLEYHERGTQIDLFPSALNPNEDHVEARGFFIQNDESDDEAVGVGREGDDLVLSAERTSVRGELENISHVAVNASGVHQVTGEAQTLDGTPTSILSLTLTPRRVYWLEAKLVASEDEGNERAYFVRAVLAQCDLNGEVLLGDVQTSTTDKTAGWEVGFSVVGSNVEVTVTGSEGKTVNWAATLAYQSVVGGDNNPLLFQTDLQVSGPSNLSHDITLNGQTVAPTFRYEAKDIVGTTWHPVVGEALTSPQPNTLNEAPFTDGAKSVNLGDYGYSYGSNDFVQIGTDDFIIEIIGSLGGIRFGRYSASAVAEWAFRWSSAGGGRLYCELRDTALNNVSSYFSIPDTERHKHRHLVLVGSRSSGELRAHLDGAALGTVINIAALDDLTSDASFVITLGSDIVSASMWQGPGLLDSADQTALAAQRYHQLTGIFPQFAKGTPDPSFTRATGALLDITDDEGVTRLFSVPSGWPRLCQREDADGILRQGYLSERLSTNWLLHTTALDNAVWTKTNINVILNAAPGPFGDLFGLANTAPTSFIEQIVDVTAVAHTLSFVAKSGVDSTIGCGIRGDEHTAEFDLSTGTVVGTTNSTARIKSWGDGRYRCEMTFTPTAGSAAVGIGSLTTGDGVAVNVFLGIPQLERSSYATSFIPTTTSAATRNGDVLWFVGDDGNFFTSLGTLQANVLWSEGSGGNHALTLSDNTSNERHQLWASTSGSGRPGYILRTGGSNQANLVGSAFNLLDGHEHQIAGVFDENSASLYVDGAVADTDNDLPAGVPQLLTRIYVGTNLNGSSGQPDGLIFNVRIFKKKVTP